MQTKYLLYSPITLCENTTVLVAATRKMIIELEEILSVVAQLVTLAMATFAVIKLFQFKNWNHKVLCWSTSISVFISVLINPQFLRNVWLLTQLALDIVFTLVAFLFIPVFSIIIFQKGCKVPDSNNTNIHYPRKKPLVYLYSKFEHLTADKQWKLL